MDYRSLHQQQSSPNNLSGSGGYRPPIPVLTLGGRVTGASGACREEVAATSATTTMRKKPLPPAILVDLTSDNDDVEEDIVERHRPRHNSAKSTTAAAVVDITRTTTSSAAAKEVKKKTHISSPPQLKHSTTISKKPSVPFPATTAANATPAPPVASKATKKIAAKNVKERQKKKQTVLPAPIKKKKAAPTKKNYKKKVVPTSTRSPGASTRNEGGARDGKKPWRPRGRMTRDGSVIPGKAPRIGANGLFLQPAGRRRESYYDWDPIRGMWIPELVAESKETQRAATTGGGSKILDNNKKQDEKEQGTNSETLTITSISTSTTASSNKKINPNEISASSPVARIHKIVWEQVKLLKEATKVPDGSTKEASVAAKVAAKATTTTETTEPRSLTMQQGKKRKLFSREFNSTSSEESGDEDDGDYEDNVRSASEQWLATDEDEGDEDDDLVPPDSDDDYLDESSLEDDTSSGKRRETPSGARKASKSSNKKGKTDASSPIEEYFHEFSAWQEPYIRDDGLTLYERHRRPRRVVTGRIRRSLEAIQQEFRCAICWSSIHDARVVKDCLHRFCSECVVRSIRTGHSECPICRVSIPSRRSLQVDENFDVLLTVVMGPAARLEEDEIEALLAKQSPAAANGVTVGDDVQKDGGQSLQQAIQQKQQNSRALRRQTVLASAALRRKEKESEEKQAAQERLNLATAKDSDGESDYDSADISSNQEKEPEGNVHTLPDHEIKAAIPIIMNVALKRHPEERQLEELQFPYLRLSSAAPALVLKKFLQQKLKKESVGIDLLTMKEDTSIVLSDWIRLQSVSNCLSDTPGDTIQLFYSREFDSKPSKSAHTMV